MVRSCPDLVAIPSIWLTGPRPAAAGLALPLLVAAEAVQSATGAVYGVNRESVEQPITPPRLRGWVRGSRAAIGAGAVAAGSR